MDERNPNRRISNKVVAETAAGVIGTLSTAAVAIDPEGAINFSKNFPLGVGSLAWMLQATSEAGIPPQATLTALTALFVVIAIDGARRIG